MILNINLSTVHESNVCMVLHTCIFNISTVKFCEPIQESTSQLGNIFLVGVVGQSCLDYRETTTLVGISSDSAGLFRNRNFNA